MARKADRGPPYSEATRYLNRPSRRSVMAAMGIGGASMAAGCLGDDGGAGDDGGDSDGDDGTDGDSGDGDVEGATLKLQEPVNPETGTFLFTRLFPSAGSIGSGWAVPSTFWYMVEPGMWGQWSNGATSFGDVIWGQYDDATIEPDEINVSIRDDAVWSDGHTVTGRDAINELVIFRLFDNITPIPDIIEADDPDYWLPEIRITGFEWDDDGFTLINHHGDFDQMFDGDIYAHFLERWDHFGGLSVPTHVEPYDAWSEAIFDHLEMQLNEEWEHPMWGDDGYSIQKPLAEAVNAGEDTWAEHMRQPENVVVNGAWRLDEARGTAGYTLVPNEEHRNADAINFDKIEVDFRPENRANWAAMQAVQLDWFDGHMPTDVADDLPAEYDVRGSPFEGGVGLGIDHSSPFFSDVRGRWAFLHIIDTEELAEVAGPYTNEAIIAPGRDVWTIDDYISGDVLGSFHEYNQDFDEAARLYEEVGFTQEGGDWYFPNGERARVILPTTNNTPRWEKSLSDQLNEFGIATDLRVIPGGTFRNRRDTGDFDLWPSTGRAGAIEAGGGWGFPDWGLARSMSHQVTLQGWRNNIVNIYSEEEMAQTEFAEHDGDEGDRGIITNLSLEPEGFGGFTVEAPPVGERDGDLREWEVCAIGYEAHAMAGERERLNELYTQLAWLNNWYLFGLPLLNEMSQIALNTGNWNWPAEDEEEWKPIGLGRVWEDVLVSRGDLVSANTDNPR